jgi:hypothetical protein
MYIATGAKEHTEKSETPNMNPTINFFLIAVNLLAEEG